MKFNRFSLCFFDVLGFETRFSDLGLHGVLQKYVALIGLVNARNEHMRRLFGETGFSESAYWTSDHDAFIFSHLYGAYASDSLLVWTHTDFPAARYPTALDLTPAERQRHASGPGDGWQYHPIPCDNLLDVCNEMICHSLKIGLPLRGALVRLAKRCCTESVGCISASRSSTPLAWSTRNESSAPHSRAHL